MKVICRNNCSGKTKELIAESLEKQIPILVFTDSKRRSLEDKSLAYFGQLVTTVFYTDESYKGEVLIDDVEENLTFLLQEATGNMGMTVAGVSLSV